MEMNSLSKISIRFQKWRGIAPLMVALCLGGASLGWTPEAAAEYCSWCVKGTRYDRSASRGAKKSHARKAAAHKQAPRKAKAKAAAPADGKVAGLQSHLGSIRVGAEPGLTRLIFDFDTVPRHDLNWITEGEHLRITLFNAKARQPGLVAQPDSSLFKTTEVSPVQDATTTVDLLTRESVALRTYLVGKEPGHGPRLVVEARPGKPLIAAASTKQVADEAKTGAKAAPPPPSPLPTAPTVKEIRNNETQKPNEKEAEEIYQKAVASLRQNDTDEGEKKLRTALQSDPSYLPARVVLVRYLLEKKKLEEAASVLEKGFSHHPYSKKLGKLYINVLMKQGYTDKAQSFLTQLLERESGDASLHALRGTLFQQAGRNEDAVASFRRALDINHEPGIWWAGLGRSLDRMGRHEEAIHSYQTALSREISDPSVLRFVKERIGHLEQTVPHGTNLAAP